jgi:hypothetical protein
MEINAYVWRCGDTLVREEAGAERAADLHQARAAQEQQLCAGAQTQ